jgi:hypothetical protein
VPVEVAAVVCCIIGQAMAGAEIKAPKAAVANRSFFMAGFLPGWMDFCIMSAAAHGFKL